MAKAEMTPKERETKMEEIRDRINELPWTVEYDFTDILEIIKDKYEEMSNSNSKRDQEKVPVWSALANDLSQLLSLINIANIVPLIKIPLEVYKIYNSEKKRREGIETVREVLAPMRKEIEDIRTEIDNLKNILEIVIENTEDKAMLEEVSENACGQKEEVEELENDFEDAVDVLEKIFELLDEIIENAI